TRHARRRQAGLSRTARDRPDGAQGLLRPGLRLALPGLRPGLCGVQRRPGRRVHARRHDAQAPAHPLRPRPGGHAGQGRGGGRRDHPRHLRLPRRAALPLPRPIRQRTGRLVREI
ncbi:hypothetical protein LTR94_034757, partial [Friedmanniomyces endolithicus]